MVLTGREKTAAWRERKRLSLVGVKADDNAGKRAAVQAALKADPGAAVAVVAEHLGVSPSLVGRVRTELASRLLAAIKTPNLPDASCRGQHELFDPAAAGEDPTHVEQRFVRAVRVCAGCAEFIECRRWLDQLPAHQRPAGVVAGRINPNERTAP